MEKILYFLSMNMTTVVMILIAVLIVILFILTIYDLVIKQREKAARKEYELELAQMNLEEVKEQSAETLDKTAPIKVIKYVEEDPELEKTKAKLELANLKEELIKKEAEEKLAAEQEAIAEAQKEELEEVIEEKVEVKKRPEVFSPIGIDLETEKVEESEVVEAAVDELEIEAYEAKQEEDAIISIDELNKVKESRGAENIRLEEDETIPISIDELYKTAALPKVELSDFNTVKEEKTADEVIEDIKREKETLAIKSPLFSRLDEEIDLSYEDELNADKLNDEMLKSGDFLARLKELKSKLN